MKKPTFICSECGERRNVAQLSDFSRKLAGTNSAQAALLRLTPANIVCAFCEDGEEVYGEDGIPGEAAARNDVEAWELSGLHLDPARLQAYRLNY